MRMTPDTILTSPMPAIATVGGQPGDLGMTFMMNWTVVNNDATPNTLTVRDGRGNPSTFPIAAGVSAIFKKVPTKSWLLSGTAIGATASWPTEADPASVKVPGTVNVSVTSSVTIPTDVGQQQLGAIDPRSIRALTTADQVTPKGGDLTSGALASNQLPASLDTGALKVAVEKPLTGAGSVQVHDTGA